jgi:SAM-dependent methyltransferase
MKARSKTAIFASLFLVSALATHSLVSAQSRAETPAPPAEGSSKPAPRKPPTAKTPDVIFVPTPQPVVNKMLELAKPKKADVVYDLGCGDGRIVVTAAKRYGVRAFGFDVDPQRIEEARENVRKNKVEHLVTIEQKDIFELDLSPASVVTLYLLPDLNVRLIPQLAKLKPGSRIVSHDYDMRGVVPEQVASVRVNREHPVFLWRTPLKREATPMGSRLLELAE